MSILHVKDEIHQKILDEGLIQNSKIGDNITIEEEKGLDFLKKDIEQGKGLKAISDSYVVTITNNDCIQASYDHKEGFINLDLLLEVLNKELHNHNSVQDLLNDIDRKFSNDISNGDMYQEFYEGIKERITENLKDSGLSNLDSFKQSDLNEAVAYSDSGINYDSYDAYAILDN